MELTLLFIEMVLAVICTAKLFVKNEEKVKEKVKLEEERKL